MPKWLWQIKLAWLTFFVVAAAIVFCLFFGATEKCVRLTGLALQLLGLGTAAWGIANTRASFGHKSFFLLAIQWLKACPLLIKTHYVKAAACAQSTTSSAGEATRGLKITPNALIDERIANIEYSLELIQASLLTTNKSLKEEIAKVRDIVKAKQSTTHDELEKINAKIEATAAGGIQIAAMGTVWVFLGLIFGTASPEIASFLSAQA